MDMHAVLINHLQNFFSFMISVAIASMNPIEHSTFPDILTHLMTATQEEKIKRETELHRERERERERARDRQGPLNSPNR